MTVTLGLDLGPNSIGWALVDESQCSIIASGVRAFPEGVDKFGTGKEVSRNEQRRDARLARRQTQRRSLRKQRLQEALVDKDLFPADPAEQARLYALDPYELRTRALDERLTPHELGRVFLHLNQRRGFHSSKKGASRDKETSDMLAKISELARSIQASKARTLGEYLYRKTQTLDHRNREEDGSDRIRDRHTRRVMLEEEFLAIWAAQQPYHPDLLTDALCFGADGRRKSYRKPIAKRDPARQGRDDLASFGLFGLIFFQRTVYWPRSVVGLCELEPKQKRCPLGHRLAQRFRLLQEVNNIRYIDPDTRTEEALSAEHRAVVLDHLATREKLRFVDLRKKLTFDEGIRFKLERAKRAAIKGMTTDWMIAKAVGKSWHERPDDQKNAIVEILLNAETDEDAAADALVETFDFTPEEADALLCVELPAGYGGLSLMAIRKLLPHLEAGLPYMANDAEDSALHAAGYLRRDQLRRRIFDKLPMPGRAKDCKIGDIPNPVVKRALVELRKVVNAIIREYGKPDAIHVEMARSVQLGGVKRKEYIKAMRDREKLREEAAAEIRAHRVRVNHDSITRYLLWQRQNTECMYCTRTISQTQLFGGEVDIDHILPRSRSLDDSQANKVVCHRRCNADKGQRTVHEWLAAADPDRYEQVCQKAQSLLHKRRLPYGVYRRLLQENVDLDDFTNRQLVDTGYITRATVEYLHCLFDADHAVLGIKGQYTATLRRQWGMGNILSQLPDSPAWIAQTKLRAGEKNRADHRHHAIDAIVLALTNRSRLQELAAMWRIGGREGIDRSTGELLAIAAPWDNFRQSAVDAVSDIKVSHRVRRRVSGGLHENTFYGPVYDAAGERVKGVFVVRKPLARLTPNEIPLIRDGGIRRIVETRLTEAGIEFGRGKKKFGETYHQAIAGLAMPSGMPIRKVRVYRKESTIRPIREGSPGEVWVKTGANHHLCIFEWILNGKTKCGGVVISLLEAVQRAKAGLAIVQQTPPRDHPTIPADAAFLMSLSAGEMVLAEHKGQAKLWCFSSVVSTNGQIMFVDHADARPSHDARFGLSVNKFRGRKVTVDPLGRIRWAND